MKTGFTGTKRGMNGHQSIMLWKLSCLIPPGEFHHGDCVGADAAASILFDRAGHQPMLHPGDTPGMRAFSNGIEVSPPKNNLARNIDIVKAVNLLIATPRNLVNINRGSGTWFTIRRALESGLPIIVLFPDASVYYRGVVSPQLLAFLAEAPGGFRDVNLHPVV